MTTLTSWQRRRDGGRHRCGVASNSLNLMSGNETVSSDGKLATAARRVRHEAYLPGKTIVVVESV